LRIKAIVGTKIALTCVVVSFFSTPVCALETGRLIDVVRAEENTLQARVGMTVFDANTGTTWNYRGDERFPLNSTHKTFSCAALLAKVDGKSLSLNQSVSISKEMLVTYSPITEKSLSPETIKLGKVCQAAVSYSDNTAANVVFDAIGGATGFNAYMRSIGDEETRLDRKEPELNEGTPGDLRDTTTPNAIVNSLRKILLGDGLSVSSRSELTQWMLDDQVAGALLRCLTAIRLEDCRQDRCGWLRLALDRRGNLAAIEAASGGWHLYHANQSILAGQQSGDCKNRSSVQRCDSPLRHQTS
jgi:beta-lactamase class A